MKTSDLADAVGMPDDLDKMRIIRIIKKYDKKHPGYIANTIAEAKKEYEGTDKAKYGEVNKQSQGRIIFELPEELYFQLEAYIPTLFKDRKHFRWFVQNFKSMMIPERY